MKINQLFTTQDPVDLSTGKCSFVMNKEFGSGTIDFYSFENNLFLVAVNHIFNDNVSLRSGRDEPFLVLNFIMSGTSKGTLGDGEVYELQPGSVSLISNSYQQGDIQVAGSQQNLKLSIYLTKTFLLSLAGQTGSPFVDLMLETVENPEKATGFLYKGQYDPRVNMILHESFNSPFLDTPESGSLNTLFLNGKVMELVAHILSINSGRMLPKESPISPEEREKLEMAKQILALEAVDPPSLTELSKRVFLNEFKLKKGFKELFGITPYGYVRDFRFEEARRLLEKGDMNVTEIAFSIGYNNAAFFAASFKKRYGINPGTLLAQKKKYISY